MHTFCWCIASVATAVAQFSIVRVTIMGADIECEKKHHSVTNANRHWPTAFTYWWCTDSRFVAFSVWFLRFCARHFDNNSIVNEIVSSHAIYQMTILNISLKCNHWQKKKNFTTHKMEDYRIEQQWSPINNSDDKFTQSQLLIVSNSVDEKKTSKLGGSAVMMLATSMKSKM